MSDKFVRAPFVLLIAADTAGCGYHRVIWPAGALASAGLIEGRVDLAPWPADHYAACAPDIIVWQRPVEDSQLAAMRVAREACPKAFFVYELDDRLDVVPERSFHAGYIPDFVADRVAQGLAMCDAVSTTTEPMAEWLRSLGGKDVRVVPNLLPLDRVKARQLRNPDMKLRVGWVGGISHTSDLDLIRPAMAAIGEQVEWVFMGFKPDNAPVPIEFHDGVAPADYLEKMRSLDLDLVLAPLEDNEFNRAKSNLRLVEAGAIGAAVIAQRCTPYTLENPPVVAYADSPDDFTTHIQSFMALPQAEQLAHAERLQKWAAKRFTYETRLRDRMMAWQPRGVEMWQPQQAVKPREPVVVFAPGGAASVVLPQSLRNARVIRDAVDAFRMAGALGADVLYLRPASTLTETAWQNLRHTLVQGADVGAGLPLACDGPNAFPRVNAYTPVAPATAAVMSETAGECFSGRFLFANALGGPCMLLSRNMLAAVGMPAFEQVEHPEEALLEWSLRGLSKNWRYLQAANAYVASLIPPPAGSQTFNLRLLQRGSAAYMPQTPVTGLTPDEREMLELFWLRRQWRKPQPGVMGFPDNYESWSLLQDSSSPAADGQVQNVEVLRFGEPNNRVCGAWIVFTDETVTLRSYALHRLGAAVHNAPPGTVLVFADHELKVREHVLPDFKPGFDAELLLARDYVTPVCAVFCPAGHTFADRQELLAFVLHTAQVSQGTIQHLPDVLATVERSGTLEEAALTVLAHKQAIERALPVGTFTTEPHRGIPGSLTVKRQTTETPLVSIIIPTRGDGWVLQPALGTLTRLTTYPNFEIVVMHTGNAPEPDLGSARGDKRVRWVRWTGGRFNWSAVNNDAVRLHTDGDVLCFLNDDIRVSSADWLDRLVAQVLRPEIGVAGIRLTTPGGQVQHVGVVVNNGVCGHLHIGLPAQQPGNWGIAGLSHEATAVTGACMVVRRDVFDALGGFNEDLPLNYNDVEFCLRVREAAHRCVVECSAEMLHLTAATRAQPEYKCASDQLLQDNLAMAQTFNAPDPYWNPNFALHFAPDGVTIHGLGCDKLAWADRLPAPDADRVLLINDLPGKAGRTLDLLHDLCAVPFQADLSGFVLRLVAPAPANTGGWDIRNAESVATMLRRLGVKQVVLRSLVGQYGAAPPVETLLSVAKWGVSVALDPHDSALLCPWLNTETLDVPAVFGPVDLGAWSRAYAALLPRSSDTVS